ncbi:MAG: hypothetical protein AAAC48_19840 [Phyllobacterium sp.]|uniref:hypothetical protein n=1 Tax=Phyllobacterium sp. TaxID=1871046 RepID=UPI0030F33F37
MNGHQDYECTLKLLFLLFFWHLASLFQPERDSCELTLSAAVGQNRFKSKTLGELRTDACRTTDHDMRDLSLFFEECERAPRLNELASFFAATAAGRAGDPLKKPQVAFANQAAKTRLVRKLLVCEARIAQER